VQWLHKKKGFTAEMLAEKPAQNLINETNRILSQPIRVQQAIPATLTTALEENTYVFSGFKSYHQLREVSAMLEADDGGIKPFNQFKQEVQKIHAAYNERYLNAEYNFAAHSVQSAVKWQDLEKDGDRYNLQYRTANDGKVREEHQSLHNTTLAANDPFWNSYYPPNGWNCRCTAVQVLKSKYDSSDSNEAIAKGDAMTDNPKLRIFRFNPGKTKQVFPPKHPYYKTDESTAKKINELAKNRPEPVKEQKFKSGGVLQIPLNFNQGKQEAAKNIKAYTELAKMHGEKYKLLNISKKAGVKNPDALNLKTNNTSDVKTPTSENGKNAIQGAIKEASKQKVSEAYIYLEKEYPMLDIWHGMKSALQKGRAKSIETIIIRKKDGELRRYDANKLRTILNKKSKEKSE
jgi:SPP1 gp7 family putative phage head morphogenesis protein